MKKQSILLAAMLLPLLSFAATYFVTNTNDSGTGSLRQAILDANANPGSDHIEFNIPGPGPHVIQVLSQLPYAEGQVVLNAYTQPGASPASASSTAVIKIALDGSLVNNPEDQTFCGICLHNNATVRGFAIYNFGSGILVEGNNNSLRGNYIGLDASGTNAPGNGTDGFVINGSMNTIGGNSPADRNVVAGHPEEGVVIFPYTSGNIVRGNYFGTNSDGNSLLPNVMNNIAVSSSNNTIKNNVVGGGGHGVYLARWNNDTPLPAFNVVENNSIGIGADGASAIPNIHGITLNEAANNTIRNNVIAGNSAYGLEMVHTNSTGNRISKNSFFGNGQLAIDLDGNNVTENDPGDGDSGANNLLNFPVITSAVRTSQRLTVKGEVDTPNPGSVLVEIYANPVPVPGGDPSGHGEGKVYLGAVKVNPQGKFSASLSRVAAGTLISALSIDAAGNTSEFAANVAAATSSGTGLKSDGESQNDVALYLYPNPFYSNARLTYHLQNGQPVRLAVYDALGREIMVLVDGFQQAGLHDAWLEGNHLPAGTYFYRLQANGTTSDGKMTKQF